MNNEYVIKTENITKDYIIGKTNISVLKGISVDIKNGETISVIGPSGAGKSTFLHIIGLMDRPTTGVVSVTGITDTEDERILAKFRNESIGFVFQFYNLLPEFTAIENVMMPAMISGESIEISRGKAQKLISEIELSKRTEHLSSELSGGEQQRVAIARALINSPKILIADEPTGNLDRHTGENIINLILQLQKNYKFTLIVATHNEEIAKKFSRTIKLIDGLVV
ncbi:MAG: ABC transporter ATP-binding protein [Elusimicrobia bacterium RIFOXYD2_FULL_34_15]|nr:MAG: ABC transporter ATP-binding protein [Elusimicrobia bacterium RIFOXYD2_FULL_34_15]